MADVTMTDVKSSQVHSIGYDPETRTLHVRFHDRTNKKTGVVTPGATYAYDDVPAERHAALLAADAAEGESVGAHFGQHIRGGGFAYRKLED